MRLERATSFLHPNSLFGDRDQRFKRSWILSWHTVKSNKKALRVISQIFPLISQFTSTGRCKGKATKRVQRTWSLWSKCFKAEHYVWFSRVVLTCLITVLQNSCSHLVGCVFSEQPIWNASMMLIHFREIKMCLFNKTRSESYRNVT